MFTLAPYGLVWRFLWPNWFFHICGAAVSGLSFPWRARLVEMFGQQSKDYFGYLRLEKHLGASSQG